MKVIVLGSGVIGVATAYYLMADGHEVVVVDRQAGAGLETSFSNGGQLVASHAEPWAAPGAPAQLVRWLFRRDAPMRLRLLRFDPALLSWGLRFLRNCTAERFHRATERNVRLGVMNRALIARVREDTGIDYDASATGSLLLYREAPAFDEAAHHAETITALGCALQAVTPAQCVEIEPALARAGNRLAGALFAPEDELGDAHKFTDRLARYCAERGADFRFGVTVEGVETDRERVAAVRTSEGVLDGDAVVLALGSGSAAVARRLGIALPVYPVKGYAITAPIRDDAAAPRAGVGDMARNTVFTRLGDRLRVVSTAEFAGFDLRPDPRRAEMMRAAAADWFPDAADLSAPEPWCGLRPATPDQVPVLGPTRYANLWLNTGHGTLGWTQACASGRITADLVGGRDPGFDLDGFTVDRF